MEYLKDKNKGITGKRTQRRSSFSLLVGRLVSDIRNEAPCSFLMVPCKERGQEFTHMIPRVKLRPDIVEMDFDGIR